eukprot:IDg16702t1
MPNTYLFGELNMPAYMEQPCDSSGIQLATGRICKLQRSIYGLCQDIAVQQAHIILRRDHEFIVIAILVDDIVFVSISNQVLKHLYNKLKCSSESRFLRAVKLLKLEHNADNVSIDASGHRILSKHSRLPNASQTFQNMQLGKRVLSYPAQESLAAQSIAAAVDADWS